MSKIGLFATEDQRVDKKYMFCYEVLKTEHFVKLNIYPNIAHLSKTAHLSKNSIFLWKWQISLKTAHLSKNGTFIQKRHIYPKIDIHPETAQLSKNCTFSWKRHIYPKMDLYPKIEHLSKLNISPKNEHLS